MLDYECKLFTLQGGSALRSRIVTGWCSHPPRLDKMFVMIAKPLESATEGSPNYDGRMVSTSAIVDLEEPEPGTFVMKTYSGSKYCVEITKREVKEDED